MSAELTDWACARCGWNITGSQCALLGPPDEEQRLERVLLCENCWKKVREGIMEAEA